MTLTSDVLQTRASPSRDAGSGKMARASASEPRPGMASGKCRSLPTAKTGSLAKATGGEQKNSIAWQTGRDAPCLMHTTRCRSAPRPVSGSRGSQDQAHAPVLCRWHSDVASLRGEGRHYVEGAGQKCATAPAHEGPGEQINGRTPQGHPTQGMVRYPGLSPQWQTDGEVAAAEGSLRAEVVKPSMAWLWLGEQVGLRGWAHFTTGQVVVETAPREAEASGAVS